MLVSASFTIYGAEPQSVLPFPSRLYSLQTNDLKPTFVYRYKNQILSPEMSSRQIIITPFQDNEKSRNKKFGRFRDRKKYTILPKNETAHLTWNGVDRIDNGFLILDGENLEVIHLDNNFQLVMKQSIAWDILKPPADDRGEPTSWEVNDLRKKFRKSISEAAASVFSGWGRVPQDWNIEQKVSYLISTNIPDFPFLTMVCSEDYPSSCHISRACYVEGLEDKSYNLKGLTFKPNERSFLVGDSLTHQIIKFKYSSCYHIEKLSHVKLPKKIREITSLFVDEDKNLWISTRGKDDFHNASIYYWPDHHWLAKF